MNLIQQRKWDEAEKVLRDCLAIREKLESENWKAFHTRALIGHALLERRGVVGIVELVEGRIVEGKLALLEERIRRNLRPGGRGGFRRRSGWIAWLCWFVVRNRSGT